MADVYGSNYQKEWVDEPAVQADPGTRNARILCFYDEFTGIADTNDVHICKIQNKARFIGIEALDGGTLGDGALNAVDKDGNATAISEGDMLDGEVDGGLKIVQVADATTSAALKLIVKFLMD